MGMCSTGHSCLRRGWLPPLGSLYLTVYTYAPTLDRLVTKLMFMTPAPPPPVPLFTLSPPSPPQGLYEYAKPAWQERPRLKVDEEKLKHFRQNVAPRPLNPAENQLQLYPVTMEVNGVKAPRYRTCAVCFQVYAGDTHACRDVIVPVKNWPCTFSHLLPSTLLLPPSHSPSLFCFPCFC